jgi:carbonic anhydrase
MTRFHPALFVALGLAAAPMLAAQAPQTHGAQPAAHHEKHWGYEDSDELVGPANWGTLPGDKPCSAGTQQTPVSLSASKATSQDLPNLVFGYKPSRLAMTNNGHTIQMDYDAGSTLGRVGMKDRWTLAQFHFHDPSEHTVDGVSYPLEMHLVHVDAGGKPAVVVAVFIKAGKENAALARAFQALPAHEGNTAAPAGVTIDAGALLPADHTFFTYPGSLTTPPCTEGITWFVLKMPIEMSQAQIDAYTRLEHLGHTNRPIQNLGSRTVRIRIDSTPGK